MSRHRHPTVPTVTIRATYGDTWFPSDEPDTDPAEAGGWTDPRNPWGDVVEMPADVCGDAVAGWKAENVPAEWTLTLPIMEAVDLLADFPGAVWDFGDGCESSNVWAEYAGERISVGRQVTAHASGPGAVAALTLLADR